ncbi:MAG: 3-oxoacyl-ACP reductase [Paenibacillaceae bacterium ZCTH02-B3]|nr:MAG: 3-oxoacyl-ACP reductase [Paenibacillaceae bacterium ZCTH02-B3]
MKLQGKTAVVTAASRGLGKGIALRFAREGARLFIASRSEEAIRRAAEDIREQTGAEVACLAADISRREDADRLLAAIRQKYGAVDILVNNAGGPPAGLFLELDDEAWRQAFELNLMSVVRMTRGIVPLMKERGGGRIVNIISYSIKQPIPGLILSNAMRAAVAGLTKTLSMELAPYGILVNGLAPGRILTDRIRELDRITAAKRGITPEEAAVEAESGIPMGRSGTVEEFAGAALFLASGDASYVTGQMLIVDGGLTKTY